MPTIKLDDNPGVLMSNPLEETKNHIDERVDIVNHNIERIYKQSEEGLARSKDAYDISKNNKILITELINTVNDVDFRRTEFEVGDKVLAKDMNGKKYKRGTIVGFGTHRRIFIATFLGHIIADEADIFLISRKSNEGKKKCQKSK